MISSSLSSSTGGGTTGVFALALGAGAGADCGLSLGNADLLTVANVGLPTEKPPGEPGLALELEATGCGLALAGGGLALELEATGVLGEGGTLFWIWAV